MTFDTLHMPCCIGPVRFALIPIRTATVRMTKTDSGITVTYPLVLLKTPWPLRVLSFPSELSQLFRCPGNSELSIILGPCKEVLGKP